MLKLNIKVEPNKGRPSKKPADKSNKYFKVYCTEKEYLDFQDYCDNLGIPVSKWFGKKMRKALRMVRNNEQK